MQVVLTQRVPKLGDANEIVTVKPGYARNYLLPQGLAIPATQKAVEKAEKHQAEKAAKVEAKVENAQEIADKAKALTLTFSKKARTDDDDATLYGSVSEKDVAQALKDKGLEVTEKMIEMDAIKNLGEHSVKLNPADDISVKVNVKVERES